MTMMWKRLVAAAAWLSILSLSGVSAIIGGTIAPPGAYPYYVKFVNTNGEVPCGGTLIARDLVITAAGCGTNLLTAMVGFHNAATPGQYETIAVAGYLPTPGLLGLRIVKLARPSTKMWAILNLDPLFPKVVRQAGTIAGVGATTQGPNKPASNTLQQVGLEWILNTSCKALFDVMNPNNRMVIANSNICMARAAGTSARGMCKRDAGGPMVMTNYRQQVRVVGIMAWGADCTYVTWPTLGIRTSSIASAVKTKVCANTSNPPIYFRCNAAAPAPAPTPANNGGGMGGRSSLRKPESSEGFYFDPNE